MKTRLVKCFQDNFLSKFTRNLFFVVILLFTALTGYSQVAINDTGLPPDPDAMLDVSSFDKGLLVPRILSLNRPPAKPGLLFYQMDLMVGYPPGFYYSDGNDWIRVGNSAFEYWLPAVGPDIRFPYKVALGEFSPIMAYMREPLRELTITGLKPGQPGEVLTMPSTLLRITGPLIMPAYSRGG